MIDKVKSKAETLIPDNVQDFAREFTALARQYGLHKATVTLTFGYHNGVQVWDDPITISWEDGRHGDSAHYYRITTSLRIDGTIK